MTATEPATDLLSPVTPKQPRKRVNYALAATLVATGVTYAEAAKQVGAKTGDVLRVGLNRKGVSAKQARALPVTGERIQSVTLRVASQASTLLRDQFSDLLAQHTAALSKVPVKPNLKHITKLGQAMEPLARTAKIVHDWGNDSPSGIVMMGQTSLAEAPDCGVDATMGSVPIDASVTQIPQDTQQSVPESPKT